MKTIRSIVAVAVLMAGSAFAVSSMAHAQDVASPPTTVSAVSHQDSVLVAKAFVGAIAEYEALVEAPAAVRTLSQSDAQHLLNRLSSTTGALEEKRSPEELANYLLRNPDLVILQTRTLPDGSIAFLMPERLDYGNHEFVERANVQPAVYNGYVRRREFNRLT